MAALHSVAMLHCWVLLSQRLLDNSGLLRVVYNRVRWLNDARRI